MSVSQLSQEKPEGNTKSSGSGVQVYMWTWTIPMENFSASQLSQHLKVYCKKFTFSGEQGESGYKHWQGQCSLIRKEYFATVKNILGQDAHIEPTKRYFASLNYTVKKDATFLEGPYSEKSEFLKLPEKLYEWQQKVVDMCSIEPDDRTINWFWEPEGCKGKTVLCKILFSKFGANIIGNGAMKDIAFSIDDAPKVVVMNITRSNESYVNYGAIEAVKDGLIFSAKYESKCKVFNSPHVFVFANFKPVESNMSKDRWNVIRI